MNPDTLMNYPDLPDRLPAGDMPNTYVDINEEIIRKARILFPYVVEEINELNQRKTVISVYGSSGTGKSSISAVLSRYLSAMNLNTYVLSGDNYPHRIPVYNDRQRELIYQEAGEDALAMYLGSEYELNYKEVNGILFEFHTGRDTIFLRRMGRKPESLYYEPVSFRDVDVLILEWTHGNNPALRGIDIPVYLEGTPEDTLAARLSRNRDTGIDSPFVSRVLHLEYELLESQRDTAKIILPYKL